MNNLKLELKKVRIHQGLLTIDLSKHVTLNVKRRSDVSAPRFFFKFTRGRWWSVFARCGTIELCILRQPA